MTGAIADPPVGVIDGTDKENDPAVVFRYVFSDQVVNDTELDVVVPAWFTARTRT
jgi:hypothetical protein